MALYPPALVRDGFAQTPAEMPPNPMESTQRGFDQGSQGEHLHRGGGKSWTSSGRGPLLVHAEPRHGVVGAPALGAPPPPKWGADGPGHRARDRVRTPPQTLNPKSARWPSISNKKNLPPLDATQCGNQPIELGKIPKKVAFWAATSMPWGGTLIGPRAFFDSKKSAGKKPGWHISWAFMSF